MTKGSESEEMLTPPVGHERLEAVSTPRIDVGDDIIVTDTRWSFGGNTHEHFDEHVNKSVPLYGHGHQLIEQAIEFFSRPGGTIIDMGCSTGTLLERIAQKPTSRSLSLIGLDIEADMVKAARRRCAHHDNISIAQGDALTADYRDSQAVIMYYTLQFVAISQRFAILRRVADGLVEGGALFLFEKVLAPDPFTQDITAQLYQEYKVLNGFSADEIINKANSLRSIMAPVLSEKNVSDLREAGFSKIITLQKYLCFEGVLAIK